MPRRYINQFRDNEKIEEIYQISEKQLRPNKNGNLYLQFNLSDKTGMISGRLWNVNDDVFYQFENGDYVLAEGVCQRFQGTLQFIAKKLTKIDTKKKQIDETEFVRFNSVDVAKKKARLLEILHSVTNPDLRNLTDCILIDDALMEQFCKAPAGVKLHHAYPGGLLEHSVQMMEVAEQIAGLYPTLNRDLLLVGAFLHDVGKTTELSFNNEMFYSDQGQMLGHSLLGIEILNEKIKETEKNSGEPFNAETAMILKHLLLSHHGAYENQSAKLPMTLEAIALHFIDSLDSKLAEFRKYMLEDPNLGGNWTNYIPGIERKLYKGKTVGNL
ncbi:MAG: HD domain-containing protein [Planctomycetaceae bacterium]|jgi:3'-5' exoribonuclease|nr:HD domain-containing protein [Planctomycetaceae bacterium]